MSEEMGVQQGTSGIRAGGGGGGSRRREAGVPGFICLYGRRLPNVLIVHRLSLQCFLFHRLSAPSTPPSLHNYELAIVARSTIRLTIVAEVIADNVAMAENTGH